MLILTFKTKRPEISILQNDWNFQFESKAHENKDSVILGFELENFYAERHNEIFVKTKQRDLELNLVY